jgi:serine/threonine-protein kinase
LASTAAPPKRNKGPIVAIILLLVALIAVVAFLLVTQLGDDGAAASIPVPSVVGETVPVAKLHLAAQKLENVTVVHRANDQIAKGLVVRQDPSAGTKVNQNENIRLTVSDGAGSVKVPDVVGESFEDAQAALDAQNLNAVREDEASDTVPLGQVTRTDPPANASIDRNSNVKVYVSAGPAPVNVPNVTGQDQVEATQTLNTAGLKVSKTTQPSSTVPAGSVISTNPAAGTQAPRGSTLTMVVSSGPEQVDVPNVVGRTQSDATSALTAAAFDVRVVQVPSSPANSGKVITQAPIAGQTVNKGTQVTITVGTGPGGSTTTSS